MVNNEEIMDMLKMILEKIERLESIKSDNVNISSGTISIMQTGAGAISISEAGEVNVTVAQESHIGVGVDETNEITVIASSATTLAIDVEGNIEGDFTVIPKKEAKVTLESNKLGE